jgi:hypothetical protein
MIDRLLHKKILGDLSRGKIIVVLGARQIGKTTILDQLAGSASRVLRLNCDNYDEAQLIENRTSTELRQLVDGYDMVLIDEAQRVINIGMSLKKIGDLKLDGIKIVVTGSSSFDIANRINEPATGRLIEYQMFPLSLAELASHSNRIEEKRMLATRLIYGMYPEVVTDFSHAKQLLSTLTNNYLYKDILSYKGMKKPEVLQKLLQALALQVGSEVSYNELSQLVGIDRETVENYITLLEKCFVIFRLPSLSRNQRNEIKKGRKVYFYDNGVRNAILSNFAPVELRNDVGMLWENLMISERKKRNAYCDSYANMYFWRTHTQKEIDLVEEEDGMLRTFEFKWNPKAKASMPQDFSNNYPNCTFNVVTPDTFWDFVL